MLELDILCRQHRAIRVLLQALRTARIETPDGRALLQLTRNTILNHLHEEDLEFYPRLDRDATLGALADAYFGEMRAISREVTAFFDTCTGNDGASAFTSGFETIRQRLLHRMEREEARLYPACGSHAASLQDALSIDLR